MESSYRKTENEQKTAPFPATAENSRQISLSAFVMTEILIFPICMLTAKLCCMLTWTAQASLSLHAHKFHDDNCNCFSSVENQTELLSHAYQTHGDILTRASIAGSASITAVKHFSAFVRTATAVSHNTFSIYKQQITSCNKKQKTILSIW